MFKKLTLVAAAGAGYVLGAKAGKERYAQIEAKFRELAGMPAVQHATATVRETAVDVAGSAKAAVNDKVEAVSAKVSGGDPDVVVDLASGANSGATTGSTKAGSTTGSTTGSTKAGSTKAGAAASGSAPDVTTR